MAIARFSGNDPHILPYAAIMAAGTIVVIPLVAIGRGEPSVTSSLVLLGTVVLFTLAIRARRRA